MRVVNLAEMLGHFDETWSPRVVGELNGHHVKLAKLHGEFVWHHHENEDELFLVVKGRLRMRLRDGDLQINEGEFLIVPRGVEHLPVADEECHLLLFEPASTRNTGNVEDERLVEQAEMSRDVLAYDEAKKALAEGEELVSSTVTYAILDGGNPVRVWREHRGQTQQELARTAGISIPYLSQIESGKRQGSTDVLRALARALRVSLDDIVGR